MESETKGLAGNLKFRPTGSFPLLFCQLALAVSGDDSHPLQQLGKFRIFSMRLEQLMEGSMVQKLEVVLRSEALESIPLHYVFWYILNGVLEEERVPVAELWEFAAVLERNLIYVVAKGQFLGIFGYLPQARPVPNT